MPRPAVVNNGIRNQTLERALRHNGLVIVESPVGFDGGGFLGSLFQGFEASGRVPVDLVDPDEIEQNNEPAVAVIRAPLHAGLRGWRDTVTARHEQGSVTVVVLPTGVAGDSLADEPLPTLLIDGAVLLLSAGDVSEMAAAVCGPGVIDDSIASFLTDLGDGWPAWVDACLAVVADQGVNAADLITAVGAPSFRRRLVTRYLNRFDDDYRYAMSQLAHFRAFSDAAATAVGGVEFAETVLPHAPGLLRTPSGLLTFVGPVQAELIAEYKLDPVAAEALAPVLVADGELISACQALCDAGMQAQAAELLDSVPGRLLDMGNQRELLALLRVLGDHVESLPGLALKRARIHANLAEVADSVASCEAVLRREQLQEPVRHEAAIELLLYRHRTISQDEAAAQIADLFELVGDTGPLPTRLREIEAQILGQSPDNHVVQHAADRFIEVAAEWEFQQEYLRAAKTLRQLCVGPLLHLGQYRLAQSQLERASRLAISQTFDFGVTLCFKTRFDTACADTEAYKTSSEHARLVIESLGIGWLEAYLHWSAAIAAAWEGSVPAVERSFNMARHLLGPLYESDTGVVITAEVAALFATLGEHARAEACLHEVRARAHQNQLEFDFAEIIVLARRGEYDTARDHAQRLFDSGRLPMDRRWRLDLELLLARRSVTTVPDDEMEVLGIEVSAQRAGLANLLALLAPSVFAADSEAAEPLRICILGRFHVGSLRQTISVPEGQSTDLLKLLAVAGGRANVETVLDHFWPDDPPAIGLRRLKNVVKKTRMAIGDSALVREADSIALGDVVATDLQEFLDLAIASEAHRTTDRRRAAEAAMAALDRYQGPLLPDDLYSDAFNTRRVEIRRRAGELLTWLADETAVHSGWLASARQRVESDA